MDSSCVPRPPRLLARCPSHRIASAQEPPAPTLTSHCSPLAARSPVDDRRRGLVQGTDRSAGSSGPSIAPSRRPCRVAWPLTRQCTFWRPSSDGPDRTRDRSGRQHPSRHASANRDEDNRLGRLVVAYPSPIRRRALEIRLRATPRVRRERASRMGEVCRSQTDPCANLDRQTVRMTLKVVL